jgi:hypothetical protein
MKELNTEQAELIYRVRVNYVDAAIAEIQALSNAVTGDEDRIGILMIQVAQKSEIAQGAYQAFVDVARQLYADDDGLPFDRHVEKLQKAAMEQLEQDGGQNV